MWAEGEAENLVARHRLWIKDALIDLQRKIKCLQVNHTSYIDPPETLFHCGASILPVQRGFIVSVYTLIPSDESCAKVEHDPISKPDMDCVLRDLENCNICSADVFPYLLYQPYYGEEYAAYPTLPYGLNYPGQETDRLCRPTSGVFTLYRNAIWLYPALQSDEVAVVEFDGLKVVWNDADVMDEDVYNREISEAVELYLRSKSSLIDDCDAQRAQAFSNQYALKVADLIHNCLKQQRLPPRNYCFQCR